jgi:ribosomal-protein-alanine N-acetyltransferase
VIPELTTRRLRLWLPEPASASAVVDYFERNRDHLAPWSPTPPAGFYTVGYWRRQLDRSRRACAEDRGVRMFAVRRREPDRVIGSCNLTEVVRGSFQACYLGYSLDREAQGAGLMSEAVRALVRYGFQDLALHRIMASYMPTNARSGALLRRLGFSIDGYARDYLFIAGAWRDHVLASLTNPDLDRPLR